LFKQGPGSFLKFRSGCWDWFSYCAV